jgi:hypothetical protein
VAHWFGAIGRLQWRRRARPPDGHPASATIKDGKYDCPSVPLGEVTVYFNIGRKTGRMIREDGGNPFPERENLVPLDAQQGVKIEVSGDAERNFDL